VLLPLVFFYYWEISKLVWVVGEKWIGWGEVLEERGWGFKFWQSV